MTYILRVARGAGLIALFLVAALLGIATGVIFAYAGDLPQISALDDYAPSTISRVYGSRGEVIGEFAIQRRDVVPYEAISPNLRQAIIAAEDSTFEQHFGLSIPRIIVTLVKDIIYRRMHGASTLTQQLARKLFLTDDKTPERKIKEALLAIRIEKRYTKREIFTLVLQPDVLRARRLRRGSGLAVVLREVRQGPDGRGSGADRRHPPGQRAPESVREHGGGAPAPQLHARPHGRGGYITAADAETAKTKPIVLRGEPSAQASVAPYFLEEVRKELESRYGAKRLYESGLSARTALDVRLQEAANRALDEGLRRVDKRRGFRKPRRNVVTEGHAIEAFRVPRWDRAMKAGDIVPAVVLVADGAMIQLRAGDLRVAIDKKGFAWTGKTAGTQLVTRGDLVEARLVTLDDAAHTATATLDQPPAVEGAVLAIDNRTGQIKAMVGGFSFERSKFNRATQAYRQVGSAFKPIVYTAAIDRGYTPTTLLMDTPASFPGGAGSPAYTPQNYDHKYLGPVTLRHALEDSRNIPAVRVMEQLGPRQVNEYARRLGLESALPPYLAVALGAAEATLTEMTSAYSAFPNQGVRMRPYPILKVSDREGNVLEENRPEPKEAIRADTAFVMTNLLRGVVQRGTAAKAAALNWPVGGKTGTTDDYTDAWFIGFDPDITVGVWIGLDQKKPIGHNQTGAEAALPIWIDVMKAWIGDRKEPPAFDPPGNIVFVSVDKGSGNPTDPGTPGAISEVFIAGTQPGSGFRQ